MSWFTFIIRRACLPVPEENPGWLKLYWFTSLYQRSDTSFPNTRPHSKIINNGLQHNIMTDFIIENMYKQACGILLDFNWNSTPIHMYIDVFWKHFCVSLMKELGLHLSKLLTRLFISVISYLIRCLSLNFTFVRSR